MPDSEGNFKGISVPELPWEIKEQERTDHLPVDAKNVALTEKGEIVQFVAGYRYYVDEDGTEHTSVKRAKEQR